MNFEQEPGGIRRAVCLILMAAVLMGFIEFGAGDGHSRGQNTLHTVSGTPYSGMREKNAEKDLHSGMREKNAEKDLHSGMKENSVPQNEAADTAAQKTEHPQIALTFDDGPHRIYTKTLLDGLKKRGICASFFVIGENIPGNETLIKRMKEEGHLIGNHTYNHVKISDLSDEEACAQVRKTSALVREITGEDTEFVRPPFGSWRKSLEACFEMVPVLWDVDPLDWTTDDKEAVVQRVLRDVSDGDIILLHDCYESSVGAALEIADILTAEGYEFVTADRLILE